MNLQRVQPMPIVNLKCISCGQKGSTADVGWYADLDGEPFKAYYCSTSCAIDPNSWDAQARRGWNAAKDGAR